MAPDTLFKILLNVITRSDMKDCTLRQFTVLLCLRERARTVRDIAQQTKLAKPLISRTADRLEDLGLAQRQDDPEDRRSVLLVLTSTGKKFITAVTAV